MPQAAKAQNLPPKILPFQIFQDASRSNSSKPTAQNVAFPNLRRVLKQQKLQNLHLKTLPFQILQDASNSTSSKPTSQNDMFPNLPTCLKQQKLKTYITKFCLSKFSKMPQTATAQNLHPKILPFQIFQDASNSKSSKPKSPNVGFPNLPRCLKQQKLKTCIPKCCLSKASNSGKVQKKQSSKSSKLLSQNGAFPYLPRCLKQHKLKTYIPK